MPAEKTAPAFEREARYIVIKRKDLTTAPFAALHSFLEHLQALDGLLPARQFLVIESDWPEYEPAWAMIEARMTGQAPALGGESVQKIVTEALMAMVSAVTGMSPPPNEPPPDFIQAPIDRAVARIGAHTTQLQAEGERTTKDLESHKRMLLAAACDLGAIGQALGADSEADGSEMEGLATELRKRNNQLEGMLRGIAKEPLLDTVWRARIDAALNNPAEASKS